MTVPAAPLLRSACALVLFAGVAAAAPHDEHEDVEAHARCA